MVAVVAWFVVRLAPLLGIVQLALRSRHTEVSDGLVLGDFMSILDPKERQIVVLVSSGVTRVGEVASILGYANHSPVSKRLARIRQKAAAYFFE